MGLVCGSMSVVSEMGCVSVSERVVGCGAVVASEPCEDEL